MYEMRLVVRTSEGVSRRTLISSVSREDVVGMDAGVRRDAPRRGTQMALN